MKKISFIFLFTLIASLSLNAADFKEGLADALAPSADKYLMLTKGFLPSYELQKGPSVWEIFVSFFSPQEKDANQQAIAEYIYNMFIIDAAKGETARQAILDTSYTGALDPIYRSGFKSGEEIKKFYGKYGEQINWKIKDMFDKTRFLNYNPKDKNILNQQAQYINMLAATYQKNGAFSYNYGEAALSKEKLTSTRVFLLKKYISDTDKQNKNMSVIYKQADPVKMLDNSTRLGGGSSSAINYTYRPLSQECAACSYSFCKHVCKFTQDRYSLYKLLRVYEVYAKPSNGFLKNAKGKPDFFSPQGDKYPAWDYHAAALLVFEVEDGLSFTVVDTFLSKEPISYDNWLAFFDKTDTYFTITPFIRRENVEKTFMPTDKLPAYYKPHPVRK